jgi:small nuclear ribonucleoprotein (snRNP)-like protein
MQRRGGPSRTTTSEKVSSKGQSDLNKERLIFVLTSLVGQRVTARLRDNEIYEGLFHGFSPDPDFAITLKSARKLASERNKSGKVHEALIISGKDFLQVSAADVPSAASWDNYLATQSSSTGFRTDGEISQSKASTERELVPWTGGAEALEGGLEDMRHNENWDQFATNLDQFGVTTTFNEELYTTKLDPNSIPAEMREKADQLAREIMAGQMSADVEANIDGEDDEEGRFSAVQGTGAYGSKKQGQSGWGHSEALVAGSSSASSAKARGTNGRNQAPLPQIPQLSEDRQRQDDSGPQRRLGAGANSPSMMKTSMISEMKRINALNLEPAVPKLEDKAGGDWMTYQQSQSRAAQKSTTGANDLKMNFQQSLDLIHKREASKQQQQQAKLQQEHRSGADSDNWRSPKGGNQLSLPPQAMAQGEIQRTAGGGGDSTRSKFTFNAGAASFTPSNASASNSGSGPPAMMPSGNMQQPQGMSGTPKAASSSPAFNMFPVNSQLLEKKLEKILDSFYDTFRRESYEALSQLEPQWTEAQGPSYKDVLGQPVSLPGPVGNMGAPQPMAMAAPWQPQQQPLGQGPPPPQGQGGNAPQMMQQPVMFQAPGGQNQPMFQPMFQPGPNASMPPQRPQAGNMPPPQDQQSMGDGNPHGMDYYVKAKQQPQGGQFMVSPPGGQPQGGMMMMMVPQQGGAMPKYGQVMMAPAGQFPQFPQGGGQPGGPGPGGPGGNPHGGQWQVANAHMVPGHMMQQVGPRGPPHQMGGHEG